MTNDLYEHFGHDRSLIPLQKQVKTDIYNILKSLGLKPQTPDCVAISTKNGLHKIYGYPFDKTLNHFGSYEHCLYLEFETKYRFEDLEKFIKYKVERILKIAKSRKQITMTDNIEKLYELAGVPRIYSEFNNGRETVVENVFSPYRQLELIKWLATNFSQNCILHIDRWTRGKVRFALDKEKYTEPYYENDYAYGDIDFSQALSGLVIELWNDLNDTQKEEIKEILQ